MFRLALETSSRQNKKKKMTAANNFAKNIYLFFSYIFIDFKKREKE
jgi:hypothetical protein